MGFPCGSAGKKSACNLGDLGDPWVGKIHWRRGLGRSPGEEGWEDPLEKGKSTHSTVLA